MKIEPYEYKSLNKNEIELITWAKNEIKEYKEFIKLVKSKKMESDFELENELAKIFD